MSNSRGLCVLCGVAILGTISPRAWAEEGAVERGRVVIRGTRPETDNAMRRSHSLPEVSDAIISVTKKTSVTKLDEQPASFGNERALFARLPGVLISEQQNPDQLNFGYRGIGNPQESEYVLVMQDGLPIMSDWIGFPTLYYFPASQSLESVQLIRGGSGLLYGPEPQPVINLVSRRPDAHHELTGRTEHVGGSDSMYSTYNEISGTQGNWSYLAS